MAIRTKRNVVRTLNFRNILGLVYGQDSTNKYESFFKNDVQKSSSLILK